MGRLAGAFCAAASVCACGDNQEPDEATALWDRIHEADYASFATAPGYESRQPSSAPHSDYTQVFLNDVMVSAQNGSPIDAWPVGSLIVKEGTLESGALDLVAVMDKREDGWFWAEYTDVENGEAKFSGKPDLCIDCHGDSSADFVWTVGLPE